MQLRDEYQPEEWSGITHRLYYFGRGLGALAVIGHPAPDLIELHPIHLAKRGNQYGVDYSLAPQVDGVTADTLDAALAQLELDMLAEDDED